jgi:hypothetical protein
MSTEQILHPEKYLGARDLPRAVALPPDLAAVLGEGWTEILREGMGELGVGLLLNAAFKPNIVPVQVAEVMGPGNSVKFKGETATAAEGWDGDLYALLQNGDRLCSAWASVWDRPEDAAEFAASYGRVIERRYGSVRQVPGSGSTAKAPPPSSTWKAGGTTVTRWSGTRDGETAVVVRGDAVFVAERVPADRLDVVLETLLSTTFARDPADAVPAGPAEEGAKPGK